NNRMISFNNWHLAVNFERREVFIGGHFVNLTFTEFKILEVLVKHPKKTFNRRELSYETYGYRYIGDGRTIDVHIKNIRKKIEEDPKNPKYIVTKIKAGYKFNCEPDQGS
ncbi:MAG TPA: winged helix-turn-helix domain-containing protein, partial [Bacillales bacterium]|nr:winged helix-turn-helix domain-containing protein [Bacillales bacterium]